MKASQMDLHGLRSCLISFVVIGVMAGLSSQGIIDKPPTFITKPDNVTVKNGQNADFKCKAIGFPVPTITWYKKGIIVRPITMKRHYVGVLFKTLYIMPVYWSDAGQITCEASNPYGKIQAHAYLRVVTKTKPTWKKEPNDVDLYIGQKIEIPCKAEGFPDPTYSWTDEFSISANLDPDLIVKSDGSLLISSADVQHNGEYTCTARNSAGSIRKTIYITVVPDPSVVQAPNNAVAVIGADVSLKCVVTGSPSTNVTWQKDGKLVVTKDNPRLIQAVSLEVGDVTKMVNTLTILRAIKSDAGMYRCVASNKNGVRTSAEAKVSLAGSATAPKILQPYQTVSSTINTDVTLKCIFTGVPLPQIAWLRDLGDSVIVLKRAMGNPLNLNTVESTYTVVRASYRDTGNFVCMGHNSAGAANGNITLIVTADPRKPEGVLYKTKIPAMIGSNTTLECRFTGSPQPEITWSRNGQDLADSLGQKIPGTNDTYRSTFSKANLMFNDSGSYQCLGENPHGKSTMKVYLDVQGIPFPPTKLHYNVTSRTSVLLSWTPGINDGSPVTFIIEYKGLDESSWTELEVGSNSSKILENSDGWNNVIVRVKARNKHGVSPPSKQVYIAYEDMVAKQKPPRSERSTDSGAVVGGVIGAVLLVAVVVLLLLVIWRRRRKRQSNMQRPIRTEPSVRFESPRNREGDSLLRESNDQNTYEVPTSNVKCSESCRPQATEENEYETIGFKPATWEVPKRCLTIGKNLGSGHFGKVVKGTLKTKTGPKDVAVKMLKENADAPHKKEFLAELDLMKSLGTHPNIVGLVGCCTKGDNPYIIVEYCSHGNLRNFLRQSRGNQEYSNLAGGSISLTPGDLLSFMWQVARGMSFLASKKMVHRDLAARNVLVDDGKVCKIADFGLARDIYQENQYLKTTEGELPLRWMALESIFHGITTIESDVWSFGILMWEIITLGANPYPGFTREQLISNLHLGYRMPRPPYCSEELYGVIWECWKQEPSDRPTFTMLCRTLHRMHAAEKVLIDLMNFDAEYINAKKDGEPASP